MISHFACYTKGFVGEIALIARDNCNCQGNSVNRYYVLSCSIRMCYARATQMGNKNNMTTI